MARGTPVIAINSGGPTESVKNGVTGFLLGKNKEEWHQCMENLQTNAKLREKIGISARNYAHEEFSLKSMGQKMHKEIMLLG